MAIHHSVCIMCHTEFSYSGRGRPRVVCGIECRRLRDNEIARHSSPSSRGTYQKRRTPVTCRYADCCNMWIRDVTNRTQKYCELCKPQVMKDYQTRYLSTGRRRETLQKQRLKRFGLSAQDYASMLASQSGRCAVCGTDTPRGQFNTWHIDHDHRCCPDSSSCGRCVRGLLCNNCNVGLGNLQDDPDVLRKAIEYLERRQLRITA